MRFFKWFLISLVAVAVVVAVAIVAFDLRIFVIQPIGAVPEGRTVLVSGVPALRLIDSPDAFCVREQGFVNLLCRGAVINRVANEGTIVWRLPYSEFLYGLTGAPETTR